MGTRQAERVVMLHSSGSSPRQWKEAAGRLRFRYAVSTPRLVGHDGLPGWSAETAPSLAGEVDALCRQLEASGPVHLVGHSAGAAVAIKAALGGRLDVASLAVYEPPLFSVLRHAGMVHRPSECPFTLGHAIQDAMRHGRDAMAARLYTDYWSGEGTWHAMPEERRLRVTERMAIVANCFTLLSNDGLALGDLARIDVPTLVMMGGRSPRPARDLALMAAATIPGARLHSFDHLGHLGPIHAAAEVNPVIEAFLEAAPRPLRARPELRLTA